MKKVFVKLNDGEKLFFTSDIHIGHKNVIKFCNRPFADVKEMQEAIIQNWNSVVSDKDSVFVLGDVLWFPHSGTMNKFFKRLNGKTIYIVPGNHDEFDSLRNDDPNRIIVLSDEVTLYVEYEGQKKEIYLSHCPMMTWPHRNKDVPNLFGHIHSGPVSNNDTDTDLPLWPKQYDVGCDNNNYTPIELRDIYAKFK